jgi:hypothetical protein
MAKSDTRKRFEEEFRKQREAGADTFEFEGKEYSTKLATAPKKVPIPTPRPKSEDSSGSMKTFEPRYGSSMNPQTEAQRVGRAVSDARSSVRRMVEPNMGVDTEAERGERAGAMAAIQRARRANIQAGNRADEGILRGSSYRKGGMVKSKKSGVRGAGCAAKGHGKMKMY